MGFKFVFPREKLDLNAILTLVGMRQGGFTPLTVFGLDFVS